jgi:Fe-S-cluster containining protein
MAKEFNCKEKCGICCIVNTTIYLSIDEVESNKYEMQRFHHKQDIKGWGNKTLKKVKKFIPELNKPAYCCFYFEPKTKDCTIYDDRPYVCRQFNCRKTVKAKLNKIWADVLKSKKTILLGGVKRIRKEA